MRKPTTGEPCAGDPLARFGGGESLPYPYRGHAEKPFPAVETDGSNRCESGVGR
jgi:hypothetical protein